MHKILLVEDKESLARMLQETLASDQWTTYWCASGSDAIRRVMDGHRFAAVLTDLRLPGQDGIEVLRKVREVDPDCPVIVMTAFGTIETAVEAMKLGAFDFIQKPIDVDFLLLLLRRCAEHRSLRFENLLLREEFEKRVGFPSIIGESKEIIEVSNQIRKVAPTDSSVLIMGESGTGKELFARAIHQLSTRKDRPFVAINCAAIPDTLIENELFGHEKGSFTGASGRQLGKFELADTGTVFLDEIGELGFGVQSKILRVLQERRFDRIGGRALIEVDVRIVCATNRNLEEMVRAGQFREDLFFRIHVFPVVIPPLRQRRSDIDALADHFIRKFSKELGKPNCQISDGARDRLRSYDWPGNIRELENCIERALILCDRNRIDVKDLNVLDGRDASGEKIRQLFDLSGSLADVTSQAVSRLEKMKIEDALAQCSNRNEAAELLGISSRALLSKMKEHGIAEGGEESTK